MEASVILSFIVPVYNAGDYLQRCINSILAQDFFNFELLLINDGSTDNSELICERNVLKDSRIRYYYQNNAGVSAARNLGLQMAHGQWCAFVDADDYIGVHYASSLITHCSVEILALFRGILRVDYQGNIIGRFGLTTEELQESSNKKDLFPAMLLKYLPFVSPWAKIFNMQVIRSNKIFFNEELHNGEDRIFVAQYLLSPELKSISVVDCDEYYYVKNPTSATSTLSVNGQEWAEVNLKWNDLFDLLLMKFSITDKYFIFEHKSFIKTMLIDAVIMTCNDYKMSFRDRHSVFCQLQKAIVSGFKSFKCDKGYSWCEYIVEHLNSFWGILLIRIRLWLSSFLMRVFNF